MTTDFHLSTPNIEACYILSNLDTLLVQRKLPIFDNCYLKTVHVLTTCIIKHQWTDPQLSSMVMHNSTWSISIK